MATLARFTMRQGLLLLIPLLLAAFLVGCGSPNDPEPESDTYTVIASYQTRGWANDVAVNGNTLYVSENYWGITTLDVTDPSDPQFVHHLPTTFAPRRLRVAPWNNLLLSIHRDALQGYVMGDTLAAANLIFGSGYVYDALLFPDSQLAQSNYDQEFYQSQGTRALRCDWNDGLHVTYIYPDSAEDDDNPGQLDSTYFYNYRDPFEMSLYSTGARGVTSMNGYDLIAVAMGDIGVGIGETDEDVSDDCGRFISDVDTPGEAWELVYSEGYLYVADQVGGMAVIDARNPLEPELVSSWKLPGLDHAWNIETQDHYLILVDQYDGIFFFDISTPGDPVYKGSMEFDSANSVRFLDDGTIVAASANEGLTFLTLNY